MSDLLCAERIPDLTPVCNPVIAPAPCARPGMALLWIGRAIPPRDLFIGVLTEARANGWPAALAADADFNCFDVRGRCHTTLLPPFWVAENTRVFYGIQLSPRAYNALHVVRCDDEGVEIEAYTAGAANMLALVSRAPWIAPAWQRANVVRYMDARGR